MTTPLASRRRPGFTLIELLVATALMLVVILSVVFIASDTFRAYDRAVGDLTSHSEARDVLDALENDLQTAVIRPDGRCWMEVVIPGSTYSAATAAPATAGNLQAGDNPILMFFASPVDRPRWAPVSTTLAASRVSLKGDTCAVAYRIGQGSPFELTTVQQPIQQVYGVYRTIIDSENTFNDALKLVLFAAPVAGQQPPSPWGYWSVGSHTVPQYAPVGTTPGFTSKTLIDASSTCWTLDGQNFIAANVVSMNLIFWCASSLPATNSADPTRVDPLKRMPTMLRPVIAYDPAAPDKSYKHSAGGYPNVLLAGASNAGSTQAAPLRYMPAGTPAASPANTAVGAVQPYEYFSKRLRIYSDRIYQDDADANITSTTLPLTYLPYSLRAIEVSVTVLTPDGSNELRALQQLRNVTTLTGADVAAFQRIVSQYGRNYTRYIRIMGNGG